MDGTTQTGTTHDDAALEERYTQLKARIERGRRIEEGQAAALPYAAMAYGEAMEQFPIMKTATLWAQRFLIVATGVIPILLFLRVAF